MLPSNVDERLRTIIGSLTKEEVFSAVPQNTFSAIRHLTWEILLTEICRLPEHIRKLIDEARLAKIEAVERNRCLKRKREEEQHAANKRQKSKRSLFIEFLNHCDEI
jgi:hypothetical protein